VSVRGALHVLCWLAIATGAGWLGLQLLGDRLGRWTTAAQALTPWIVPWVIVAALVAAQLGRHAAALTATAVGLGFLVLTAPLAFPPELPSAARGERLTVLHANLLFSNPQIDDAITTILDADADVIALSELTPEFAAAIDASEIGERYPYRTLKPGRAAVGLGIWSRVPLTDGEALDGTTMTLATDVELDGRPLSLVLAHPLPPLFDAERWRRETDAMVAMPGARRSRTLLVADLNVSYFHPPLRRWTRAMEMRNVHAALGEGFSVSWPTDEPVPPFVRLDHALVGSDVTATAIDDVTVPGSDHRAFVVTVAWAG
jgi:endonuclease/exonuclease/phosphatase (EEP) superfamily protein YafD